MTESSPLKTTIYLECINCHKQWDEQTIQTVCPSCAAPLFVRYDLAQIRQSITRAQIESRPRGLWRWKELLPVQDQYWQITLGEGDTPLLSLPTLAAQLGIESLYLKDEAQNPTASFKARGFAVSLGRFLELGVRHFVLATAGNAGAALAAYTARAKQKLNLSGENCSAHIFIPRTAPNANLREIEMFAAELHLVDGLISDAAAQARIATQNSHLNGENWLDLSTFKEPYRVEGKKTLGFELAEQLRWKLPDVIIYPIGGGTGLIGMWKAFDELEALGWINSHRPRFICVQSQGCAPIVRAYQENQETTTFWENAHTIASGLCVPKPFADRLILQILKTSHGSALAVSDSEILQAQNELTTKTGIFVSPEGAATLTALQKGLELGLIKNHEQVVLFNTASGLKYL